MTPASLMPSAKTVIFIGKHLGSYTGRGMPHPYTCIFCTPILNAYALQLLALQAELK